MADIWKERVLKASDKFRNGVVLKGARYSATKEDIERVRGRLLDITLKISKRRFGSTKLRSDN